MTPYDPERLRVSLDRWMAAEPSSPTLDSPGAIVPVLLPLLTDEGASLDHERCAVVAFDARMRVIDSCILTRGTDQMTLMDAKQILRWVLTREKPAVGFVVAHNHPGGDPKPSRRDKTVTRRIVEAAKTVGLTCFDHIILGNEGKYTSMAEQGLM
jgi:DNA repair protein RadC